MILFLLTIFSDLLTNKKAEKIKLKKPKFKKVKADAGSESLFSKRVASIPVNQRNAVYELQPIREGGGGSRVSHRS